MGQIKNFYEELSRRLGDGETLAVASISRRLGSAPRSQGTRCAVLPDGAIIGTIGGGQMEARTQEAGAAAVSDGKVRFLKLRLDSKELAASGMICGGSVDILTVPWTNSEKGAADELLKLFMENGRGALLTEWDETGRPVNIGVLSGERWVGNRPVSARMREMAAKALTGGKPVMYGSPEGAGILAEPIEREKSPLVIMGGGHVGKALADVATFAGFSVTVLDDREEFANPALHPKADSVVCRPFAGALEALGVDETTFIVICTRGHLSDTVSVVDAMRGPARYVGMIGSRRKKGMVLKHLKESGISEERLAALHSPVGIEIGSETPEEIAVSIVAEMIAVKRG